MNDVPNDKRKVFWERRLGAAQLKQVASKVTVEFDSNGMRIFQNELVNLRVKFIDVLLGPFNL